MKEKEKMLSIPYPYWMIVFQQLTEGAYVQRREFWEKIMTILIKVANTVIIMSDEAYFYLDG